MTTTAASPLRDNELVGMLGDDPELLAIADAIVATVPRLTGARRRRAAALVGLPAVTLAAAIATVVLLWPFSSSPSVLDNALAAIGTRPVIHVVVQDSLGSYLLDLHNGSRTPVSGREETWYQPGRGLFSRRTFAGAPAWTVFFPARLLEGATPSATFGSSYREQLQAHNFHVTGTGRIGRIPVYWIEGTPQIHGSPSRTEVEQVAIAKKTFKPVYSRRLLNGHIERGSGIRILSINSTTHAPVSLSGANPRLPPSAFFPVGYPPLTLWQARAIRPPLLIRQRLAGLRLVLVAQTPAAAGPASAYRLPGAAFYYGSLLDTGLPNDREPDQTGQKPYLSVTEYTRPNAFTKMQGVAAFHPGGSALIDGEQPTSRNSTATLRKHGIYIVIEGSNDALVVAAARDIGA